MTSRQQNSTNRNGSSTYRQLTGNNQDPPIEQQYNSRHKNQSHSRSGRSPNDFQNAMMSNQQTLQNVQTLQQPALTQRFSMPLSNYDNLDSSDYKNSILKKNSSIKSPIFSQKQQNQHYQSNQNPSAAKPRKVREKPTVDKIPQLTTVNIKHDAGGGFGSLSRAVGIVSQQSAQKTQRRDRSQTHHLPQTNNEIHESSQSEHRLDKRMTNRVRFQDRNEQNYSVRSNGEAPAGKELSNLREMRDQRKVSKSILRSQGYKSDCSVGEKAEYQNYDHVDGNQFSNKMTEMQNQLNQLE